MVKKTNNILAVILIVLGIVMLFPIYMCGYPGKACIL